jgi:chromate transporter
VQPVVVGILAWATVNIGRAHIRNWKGAAIAVVAFGVLLLKVDVLVVIAGCGLLGILLSGAWRSLLPRRTLALAPILPLLLALWQPGESVWRRALVLGGVFLKIGAVIFGGGFAAIPFIQHEVVDVRHWLTVKEFIDGVALGQMTPGPVAITATFVGFKVLGLPGAAIATVAVFLPSFLLILILIHVYRRVSGYPLVKGFLAGVMPAVTGMLLSATVYIGMIAIHGPLAAVMALLSLALLLRFRTDPVWLVLGGALVGLAVMV